MRHAKRTDEDILRILTACLRGKRGPSRGRSVDRDIYDTQMTKALGCIWPTFVAHISEKCRRLGAHLFDERHMLTYKRYDVPCLTHYLNIDVMLDDIFEADIDLNVPIVPQVICEYIVATIAPCGQGATAPCGYAVTPCSRAMNISTRARAKARYA